MRCGQERHTSQGRAVCHQPEGHNGSHIAYITDPDGNRWLASWWRNFVDLELAPVRADK